MANFMVKVPTSFTRSEVQEAFTDLGGFELGLRRLTDPQTRVDVNRTQYLKGEEITLKVYSPDRVSFFTWLEAFSEMMGDGTAQSFDQDEFELMAHELWATAKLT